jgi:uncharacterized protein YndB with AHSA1/START domain
MTERSAHHAAFVIERRYDAAPAEVFAAWASPAEKARWFVGPADWETADHELDFRVGGRERVSGGPKGGPRHIFEARYQDIVPDRRIVSTYDMHLDDKRISASLATVDLTPDGAGTRLATRSRSSTWTGSIPPPSASTERAVCWMRWARHCGASRRSPDGGRTIFPDVRARPHRREILGQCRR